MPKILISAAAFLSLTFIGDFSCFWTALWEAALVQVWVAVRALTLCSLQGFTWERSWLFREQGKGCPLSLCCASGPPPGSPPRDSLLLNMVQPFLFLSLLRAGSTSKTAQQRPASAEGASCRGIFHLSGVWPQPLGDPLQNIVWLKWPKNPKVTKRIFSILAQLGGRTHYCRETLSPEI